MALKDIETFIIVILENRSFDHMLGYLSLAGANPPLKIDGLSDDPVWRQRFANLHAGQNYEVHEIGPSVQSIDDPPHEQKTIAQQIDTMTYPGSRDRMGGFVDSYMTRNPLPSDPSRVMGYYTQASVPVFDFFARNFMVCDHWFASLPTGTQPNRLMAMSGECGIPDNAPVFLPSQDLVYDWLTSHQVSWCAYQSGDFLPFFALMPDWLPEIVNSLTLSTLGLRGRFRRYERFAEEWQSDKPMPQVIFVEPEYTDGPHVDPNDDHPPTGIAKGQTFLADLYVNLIANPARWAKTMMIVTYDEHGGFFDHIPPPAIPTDVGGFRFATTGVRVPAFVISPQVDSGEVFSGNLDHSSILQLLADRFNPGQTYSAAVGARQASLTRLAALLPDAPVQDIRAPALPAAALAALSPAAEAALVAAPPTTAGAAANVQAFHQAAMKIAQDHSELLGEPGWEALAAYVANQK